MQRRSLALVALLSLLFSAAALRPVNHPTAVAMADAATDFLKSLDEKQRATAVMSFDDKARTDWHFIPKNDRKGLQYKDLTAPQRERALALLKASLSAVGYGKATAIMSLEAILRELEKSRPGGNIRDPERYYFTIFDRPSATERWGLSIEGHHLSLNFVVDEGFVKAATPAFFGANPAEVKSEAAGGPKRGTRVLEREESLAFELLESLSAEQRTAAVIADKAPSDVSGAGQASPELDPPRGIPGKQLSAAQQKTLQSLIETYFDNMPEARAGYWRNSLRESGLDGVYFAWAGADKPGVGHYYRIQAATFVMEFVNVQPDAEGNPANHIHAVWRSVEGDFGL